MRFYFKRKLSCASFACSGLGVRRVPSGTHTGKFSMRLRIHGMKTLRKGRAIRLCLKRGAISPRGPIGRLGTFRGVYLHPERAGAILLGVAVRSFVRCSRTTKA